MRTWLFTTALLAGVIAARVGRAGNAPIVSTLIVGSETDYTVAGGDSLWSITGHFTMNRRLFDALNPLPDPDQLRPGMRLRISDRHIVPRHPANGIVIDLAARSLYWFERGTVKGRFPVGIGRSDWATPPGRYRIVGRREDPVWHVPPSIQQEMRAHGEPVTAVVPAGPDNPLGKYWIQLSAPGYGLHGTNAPASIGKYTSHGCLRLLPEHIARLYREAPDGTPVEVVYEPVRLARDAGGRIYVEVYRDVYRVRPAPPKDLRALVTAAGLTDAVDWARVDEAQQRAWGTPQDVTAPTAAPEPVPTRAADTVPPPQAEPASVVPVAAQRPE